MRRKFFVRARRATATAAAFERSKRTFRANFFLVRSLLFDCINKHNDKIVACNQTDKEYSHLMHLNFTCVATLRHVTYLYQVNPYGRGFWLVRTVNIHSNQNRTALQRRHTQHSPFKCKLEPPPSFVHCYRRELRLDRHSLVSTRKRPPWNTFTIWQLNYNFVI